MNLTKYYTVHEVAQSTGLNPDTIYRALQRGELTGLKTSNAKKHAGASQPKPSTNG